MSDLVERLSDHVHQAWMAEKLKQGFADHVKHYVKTQRGRGLGLCCALPDDKHHADMLPYADLPEHVKEYDRVTVRAVLEGIRAEGHLLIDTTDAQMMQMPNTAAAPALLIDNRIGPNFGKTQKRCPRCQGPLRPNGSCLQASEN